MTITMRDIKSIKDELAKCTPARQDIDRNLSTREIIHSLAPDLNRMKKRGFTTDELVNHLAKFDIHIKGETLNKYINSFNAARKTTMKQSDTPRPKKAKAPDEGVTDGQMTPEKPIVEEASTLAAQSSDQ